MKPRYIAHTSGKQPVADHVKVDVVFGDCDVVTNMTAGHWGDDLDWWAHALTANRNKKIIAYRVIEQE